ncbi:unnamed protein product, partial [Amoebophrya sp. A25]
KFLADADPSSEAAKKLKERGSLRLAAACADLGYNSLQEIAAYQDDLAEGGEVDGVRKVHEELKRQRLQKQVFAREKPTQEQLEEAALNPGRLHNFNGGRYNDRDMHVMMNR